MKEDNLKSNTFPLEYKAAYLEFLRNLTPQTILLSFLLIMYGHIDFTHIDFNFDSIVIAVSFYTLLIGFVVAIYSNISVYYNKCFSELDSYSSEQVISAKKYQWHLRPYKTLLAILKERTAAFIFFMFSIIFIYTTIAIVIVMSINIATKMWQETHHNKVNAASQKEAQRVSPIAPQKAEGSSHATNTNAEIKDGTVKIEVINKQVPQTFSLYGALIAIGVPLFVLLVTNLVTLSKIRLESKAAIKNELGMNSIERIKEKLSQFYDPIIALLNTNSEIFNGFGPRTFPEEHFAGEEALHIWSLMVNDVILPNNKEVTKIIKSYSHLMNDDDNFELYLRFVKHAASYDAFRNTPNQLHGDFSYPTDLLPNVVTHRKKIVCEMQKLQTELQN